MNTHHGTIFVIIFVVLIFIAPRYAFGQMDHRAHMHMPQVPAHDPSPTVPQAPVKIKAPEQAGQKSQTRWPHDFLSQIKYFDQAASLYAKAATGTTEERRVVVEKMTNLAKTTANAEKAYVFALNCAYPCKEAGLKAFDKMVGLAKEFSDIEAILRITAHSALESPMIEPDAKQLKAARVKIIELADTKWQMRYVLERMPQGSEEETLALAKLNTFEK
ncbi:MAG: hypothetical protein HZC03_01045 [Candidatus Lloydbacteria bacterium]|nr:hypothetical protein [Candidatus Lloydbacteria bacterium]